MFTAPPRSLEYPRRPSDEELEEGAGLLRRVMLRLGGYHSKQSRLMRGAEALHACINEQADDERLAAAVQLPDGFQPRHAFLCLHVWLMLTRLRAEGAEGRELSQMLYDSFQEDVERRVRRAGVTVRVSKQLTELEKQFYGSSMAYDRAIGAGGGGPGQETLAAALQRNVYLGDAGKGEAAAALERYCLRELACLSLTDSTAVMAGNVRFSRLAGGDAQDSQAAAARSPHAEAAPAAGGASAATA